MSAKELLKKHLGPAQMEDAINHLARMIDDGELLAATDPVQFLHLAAEMLERQDGYCRTLEILASHEPSWSDDYLRARASLKAE